jgi:hypothetical protein
MTEVLGKSVGEWSANESVNFGGTIFGNQNSTRNCDALILPNWRQCGISFSEWGSRASANGSLKRSGLTSVQIARYWKKFQDEVQSSFNKSLFLSYAMEQNAKEYDASQNQGGASGDRGNSNTNVNTDRNGNPTTSENGGQSSGGGSTSPKRNTNTTSTPQPKSDNTKYYIYGGVGLAVIIGAFLIFKK